MSEAADIEGLLRAALSPVDPPKHLSDRLERALESITTMAAEELDSWELSAMRDPRKWLRPALALLAGTGAGAALALLRRRSSSKASSQPTERQSARLHVKAHSPVSFRDLPAGVERPRSSALRSGASAVGRDSVRALRRLCRRPAR